MDFLGKHAVKIAVGITIILFVQLIIISTYYEYHPKLHYAAPVDTSNRFWLILQKPTKRLDCIIKEGENGQHIVECDYVDIEK